MLTLALGPLHFNISLCGGLSPPLNPPGLTRTLLAYVAYAYTEHEESICSVYTQNITAINLLIRSASYLASLIKSSDQLNKREYADFDSSD
jgi:hypothetical protein